jgi:small subunit ribosomal protein S1
MNVQQSDKQSSPVDKRKYQNVMPETDDGWWESVLAEEQRHVASVHHMTAPKTKDSSQTKIMENDPVVEPVQINWDQVKDMYSNDRILAMTVTGHNRGGLLVEGDSLSGFIPFSHLIELAGKESEFDRELSLETYVGKTLKVKVIECVPSDGRVVFSERAALSEPGKRVELFHSLEKGDQVIGTVTNITDFGVFVDIGGVEGLIHISELSWGRVSHPKQIVSLGEEIKVQVLDISAERCRVALSLKQLTPNPWERAESEVGEGQILPAVVTSVLSYGAFARLDAGVEGLIHASEMPLESAQTPRDILSDGQIVRVRVLHLDAGHQRLGLSMHLGSE